jgi:hypothetical protein
MSHIPTVNASKRVQVPQKVTNCVVSSKLRKRERPLGARDKVQRRRPHRQGLEPLASLKDLVEESQPTVENIPEDIVPIKTEPLKWQLNLKLRWYLKDPILKMEIPMCRAHIITLKDQNALAWSLWKITIS